MDEAGNPISQAITAKQQRAKLFDSTEESRALLRKYRAEALKRESVTFAGRLAYYTYSNMDRAVSRALACFEKEIDKKLVDRLLGGL